MWAGLGTLDTAPPNGSPHFFPRNIVNTSTLEDKNE